MDKLLVGVLAGGFVSWILILILFGFAV